MCFETDKLFFSLHSGEKLEPSKNWKMLKLVLEDRGQFSEKRKIEKKKKHILKREEMYQLYLTISKINEKLTQFLFHLKRRSYFDVALNKRNAGQGAVFCVWLF